MAITDLQRAREKGGQSSGSGLVFFRIIEKSLLASHTFLGDTTEMMNIDFFAQTYTPMDLFYKSSSPSSSSPTPIAANIAQVQDIIVATFLL